MQSEEEWLAGPVHPRQHLQMVVWCLTQFVSTMSSSEQHGMRSIFMIAARYAAKAGP